MSALHRPLPSDTPSQPSSRSPLRQVMASHAVGTLQRAMVAGGLAGLFSLATLMRRGGKELGKPAAPLNAPSQWVHGDEAIAADQADVKHTATGVLIHQASAVFWGMLFDQLWQRLRGRSPSGATASLPALAAGAASLTAIAAVVDLKLMPDRLTPGFQKRLSPKGTAMVYASFAIGLAAGAALLIGRRRQP